MNVLGYIRVSTDEQVDSRAGLEAQKAAITSECARRGWTLVETIEDAGYSGKDLKRPGVSQALDKLDRKEAEGLVVAKLDRLSRSMMDFATVMALAQRQGWALVALDAPVDTTTPAGEAMAHVLATFAQFERRLISQRTKEGLAMKRAQGVRLGRPRTLSPDVLALILNQREQGFGPEKIARRLNLIGAPTAQGGKQWYPSTVRAVLKAEEREKEWREQVNVRRLATLIEGSTDAPSPVAGAAAGSV